MNSIHKEYEAEVQALAKGEVIAVISTDSVDWAGDVMLPQGLVKRQYQGNPIVLYGHDGAQKLPIGTCSWVKAEPRRLVAKYRITDKTQLGRDIYSLMQDGVLRRIRYDSSPSNAARQQQRN